MYRGREISVEGVRLFATSTIVSSAIILPCCGTQQNSSHACMRCDVRGSLRLFYLLSLCCSQLLSTIFHYRGFIEKLFDNYYGSSPRNSLLDNLILLMYMIENFRAFFTLVVHFLFISF